MKTAVIVNDHGFVNGGQAKVAIETALALRSEGLDVCFFSGVGPVDQRLKEAGIASVCLDQQDLLGDPNRARSAFRGLWNRKAAKRLREVLGSYDPEDMIVHVHGWAKSLSPSIGPVFTAGPFSHVYTIHEYFLACPTGGFFDHAQQAICTRAPLSMSCLAANCDPRSRAHKAWRVGREAVLWSAGAMPRSIRDMIYLSETQLNALSPFLPKTARLHHLPNPVDRVKAKRIQAERNDLFLFVGRLSPEKGGELAAKAARDAGVRIVFAGEGECREGILAANPEAEMLGWLNSDALSKWLEQARCLVFPSLWYECMPMSVIEAMQKGLPVLVSDRCAASEFVRHDVDGLHVRTGDLQSWSAAMRQMQETDRVSRYSHSCFEVSQRFLSSKAYASQLISIYQRVSEEQRIERVAN